MRKLKYVICALFVVFAGLSFSSVKAIEDDDFIVTSSEQRKELFQADDNLNISGIYDGTVFFAGSNVTSSSTINGIGFIAGQTLDISGVANYGFFAGNVVNIQGTINNDLFVTGNTISIKDNAKVGRDTYLFASNVSLVNTIISRNLYISSVDVNISNTTILGNVNVNASNIVFGDNVNISGTLKYNDDASITNINKVNAGATLVSVTEKDDIEDVWGNKIVNFVISLIGMILIGIILYGIWSNLFKKCSNTMKNYTFGKCLSDIVIGFLILIAVPVISIMLMITIIGIPISIITLISYIISIYLTTIFVGYLLGNFIITKIFKHKENGYLAIVLGVFVIKLIELVPFIGGIVCFIVICLGLSLIVKMLFFKKENIFPESEVKEVKSQIVKSTIKKETK